ncbi:MAG: flavin reductase family protein [Candidatus Nanopelagicales bacterium]
MSILDLGPAAPERVRIDPAILYFGTPVALLTTINPDGGHNIMPMSSVWWIGHAAVLGLGTRSQTSDNLDRERELVINLPSVEQVDAVDRLALTTGRDPVPGVKHDVGYRHVDDKFAHAGLTRQASESVRAPRIAECPVQLEAKVVGLHPLVDRDDPDGHGAVVAVAVVTRVHIDPALAAEGHADRIDPDRWRPLVMSFQRFYGLGPQVHPSRLATIDEEWYR